MNEEFIANLKHAIRTKEIVSIGGGKFYTDELEKVLNTFTEYDKCVKVIQLCKELLK